MSSRNPPPWRTKREPAPQYQPSVPGKRSADSRPHDRPSKRSTTSNTAQEEAWVADEDRFVLEQAKKRAALRVKGGRAKPIDWLAVTLRFVDPTRNLLDDEVDDHDLDVVDPNGVFEGLGEEELSELEKDIDHYLTLETNRGNRDYWNSLKVICKDARRRSRHSGSEARGSSSVSADIEKLLAPKSYDDLEKLETQVKRKLDSNEPIDYDYWEQLLRNIRVYKAKARLRRVSQDVINERLQHLRKQQEEAALTVQAKLREPLGPAPPGQDAHTEVPYDAALDPQPALKLRPEDKSLPLSYEGEFLKKLEEERQRVLKLGFIPARSKAQNTSTAASRPKAVSSTEGALSRFAPLESDDYAKATNALYDREVARGVEEGEEVFAAEEELATGKPQWAGTYKPRKPKYFNRVQMGYEWNKYNQTHYDHDNPPPKVVQGYKFNIFYPDLIDKTKAPTYKIERENGRKRGQSFAPAGEEDTCLIRFIASPPYQDIAFRIVDKEWDYSAKRERGFKSSFDKGILQLHFQFKKIYYRK